jgi:hypothetical protein
MFGRNLVASTVLAEYADGTSFNVNFKTPVTTHKGAHSHNPEDHNFNFKIWYTNCHAINTFIVTKHISFSTLFVPTPNMQRNKICYSGDNMGKAETL